MRSDQVPPVGIAEAVLDVQPLRARDPHVGAFVALLVRAPAIPSGSPSAREAGLGRVQVVHEIADTVLPTPQPADQGEARFIRERVEHPRNGRKILSRRRRKRRAKLSVSAEFGRKRR